MDGLESCEVKKSDLERTLRFDSEFFRKEVILAERFLRSKPHQSLTKTVTISDGNHAGISDKFTTSGVPYYRGQDAGTFFIENSTPICIDQDTYNAPVMRRSHLKKNDVLLSIVGTIGSLSLVHSNRDATCSCKLAILRPKESCNEAVLAVFLQGKYGQIQISRFIRGAVQKGLILEDMDQLIVPVFKENLNQEISMLVQKAHEKLELANAVMEQATKTLSNLYNLESFSVERSSFSVKKYTESFKSTGRLDAEYYQPKFDALFTALSKYKTKKLGGADGIVTIMKSVEPGSDVYVDEGIPFIRVSDVSKYEISEPEIYLDYNSISLPEKLYPKKDTILFSKDGSVGIAYKVDFNMKAITSSALLHLIVRNTSEVLPDYLTLVLNSPIVQLQAERDSSGAIIQHWKPSEIKNVIIPVLDMEIQRNIAAKVQKSFALRRKSKQLLEYAKQAVEMAIEQGEDVALEWIKSKEGEM